MRNLKLFPTLGQKLQSILLVVLLLCLGGLSGEENNPPAPIVQPSPAKEEVPIQVLLGKFKPAEHPDFVRISGYNNHPAMYLQARAKAALDSLVADAAKAGIHLNLVSATRNFDIQKAIWERKIAEQGGRHFDTLDKERKINILRDILSYSSMPSASRHHWGTDVDLCSVELSFWNSPRGKRYSEWLTVNAANYGYYLVYSAHREGGHNYEPWHWSYLPISGHYLQEYRRQVTYEDITGFSGAEYARDLDIFEQYVSNVMQSILP